MPTPSASPNFHERRIPRIFPALLVIYVGASPLAWRYSVPAEVDEFGRSVIVTLASVSIFFAQSIRAHHQFL